MMTYKEIAEQLCEGYLNMPSGCEGCPLGGEDAELDEDGNVMCPLWELEAGKHER